MTWVRKARACVLERSELIWERLKGALGVPPELNVEDEDLPFHIQFQERLKKHQLDSLDGEGGMLDSAVFEPDSPVFPMVHVDPGSNPGSTPGLDNKEDPLAESPVDPDSVIVSPVLISTAPLPTNAHSLHEVREEEEEENEGDAGKAKGEEEGGDFGKNVHGLRFSTSPSVPIMQSGAPSPNEMYSPGTPGAKLQRSSSFGSNRSFVLDDYGDDASYDPTKERGPGRPLFPSSFANLGMGPPLRPQYVFFAVIDASRCGC